MFYCLILEPGHFYEFEDTSDTKAIRFCERLSREWNRTPQVLERWNPREEEPHVIKEWPPEKAN